MPPELTPTGSPISTHTSLPTPLSAEYLDVLVHTSMSNITSIEGSLALTNDLVQDLLDEQRISVCTTIQEMTGTQELSSDHRC
jgi:hypothetical protein